MYSVAQAPVEVASLRSRSQTVNTRVAVSARSTASARAAAPLAARSAQGVAGSSVKAARRATASAFRGSQQINAISFPTFGDFSLPSFGDNKKNVIITGASSGLGRATTEVLANLGGWNVIMAVRDPAKAKEMAAELELPKGSYTVMCCELNSLKSVSDFCDKFKASGKPLHALVCNAAVYLPNQQQPTFTEDGFEESFGVNHLAHHLMVKKLLPELKKTKGRCIIVGSITGNTNTVGGGAVLPLADLGELDGLKAGKGVAMLDGGAFNGAKAYKDAKLCNMMTVLELNRRYHATTGVTFASMYPGCIAETALFRQKRGWFRWFFPIFMRYVTGGYVSEAEAGQRLAQVVTDPRCAEESGTYWSWNGGARTVGWYDFKKGGVTGSGGGTGEFNPDDLFSNKPSKEVRDERKAQIVFDLCDKLTEKYQTVGFGETKLKAKVAA